jgi:glucosamine-6-phosphate deaminase
MGEEAALAVIETIKDLLSKQNLVNIIFAAAPSQNELLLNLSMQKNIDWQRVNAFHMDEYVGLSENDEESFSFFLKEKIFKNLPFHAVYYLDGTAADVEAECKRYTQLLQSYPTDIVCMGIGENSHIAFNDPHVANFEDKEWVKIANLDEDCRKQQVNDGCFKSINDVPTHAFTLTVPALMNGHFIFCIVPGETKAKAVDNTLHQSISEKYPATILRTHVRAVLYLDEKSSALL